MDATTIRPDRKRRDSAAVQLTVLRIIFHHQPGRWGEFFPLSKGEIVIGRGVSLFPMGPLDDPKMSREHARISPTADGAMITDLESSNGTFVNGERVSRARVRRGDVIRVGDSFMILTTITVLENTIRDSQMVGNSDSLERVKREIAMAAEGDTTVLFLGESGCGKDLAAQELHRLSKRRGEFVAINCGAVPENLLESELFGYKKGAFSGANSAKIGLFQAANGGSLFLDEIGEMSSAMQAKLLRALQNKEVRPLGSTTPERIDTRVVCATNRDLIDAVNRKLFRGDLYSRISQLVIEIPPLRARREDIPVLMAHFRPRSEHREFSGDLVEAFLLHPWPFNVRELDGVLSLAVMESRGDEKITVGSRVEKQLQDHAKIQLGEAAALDETVDELPDDGRYQISKDELIALLQQHQGNVKQVAIQLGKHRYQIYRWLKAYDIDPLRYRDPV